MKHLIVGIHRALLFLPSYIVLVVEANLQVAKDILRPKIRIQPDFIEIPLQTESKAELLTLSNLVAMTPGTLSLDVSNDGKTLLIHTIYAEQRNDTQDLIENFLQKKVIGIFR